VLPHEQLPNRYVTRELTFQFHYFFMRKLWFAYMARALVVFPAASAPGRADEILTLMQTRRFGRNIPVVLYGSTYWNEIINFDALVRHGMIDREDLALFQFATIRLRLSRCYKRGSPRNSRRPLRPSRTRDMSRRRFLQRAGALGCVRLSLRRKSRVRASHRRRAFAHRAAFSEHAARLVEGADAGLRRDPPVMEHRGDGRWTARTTQGIQQRSIPASGEQAGYLRQKLDAMRAYLAKDDLHFAEKPADIDAALSGSPRVVIAVEGAGFVADGLELLDKAYADGLRHLQLVHYIGMASAIPDRKPEHDGMTQLASIP